MKIFKMDEREKQQEISAIAIMGVAFMIYSLINCILKMFFTWSISPFEECIFLLDIALLTAIPYLALKSSYDWSKFKKTCIFLFIIGVLNLTFCCIDLFLYGESVIEQLGSFGSAFTCILLSIIITIKIKKYEKNLVNESE